MQSIRVTTVLLALLVGACSSYAPPAPQAFDFRPRAQILSEGGVTVSAAVLNAKEVKQIFAAPLIESDIQPIWLRIDNQDDREYVLGLLAIDPDYYSPAEAAWRSRGFGETGDDAKIRYFTDQAMPILLPANAVSSGFVYASFDPGAKSFAVMLAAEGIVRRFEFVQAVPGFTADYLRADPESRYAPGEIRDLDLDGLRRYLESLPCCVRGGDRKTPGDPLNLVVVGTIDDVLATFIRQGWDLTEMLRAHSAWRTLMSSLFGSRYRTSPVSPLYLFDRPQDMALQKARASISQRNHLRLWRAPVNLEGVPVWAGQVSRDIGIKLSRKTIVTHKIDPYVDDARRYVLLDLASSEYVGQVGFTKGVGAVSPEAPRYNYTEDPYFTDGLRLVLFISDQPVALDEIQWQDWEPPPVRWAAGSRQGGIPRQQERAPLRPSGW